MFHEQRLHSLYDSFYNFPWENEKSYAEYLAQSFFYIRHSTKTLALAAGHLPFEDSKVFRRMIKHVSEEMNHEILCTKDLEAIGKDIDNYTEAPATQSLYQTQYYKIQHQNPKSYLGYVYVLESICCLVVPKVVKEKLIPNYPKQGINFLRVHGEEDPGHLEQAKIIISSLSDKDQKAVADNMLHTIKSFEHFLTDIQSI
jgi:pyrroloquinoline quinone (PQQ) biosynthesis protein C